MTPDVPAFVNTGGAVAIAAVIVIALLVAIVVIPRIARDEYDLWPEGGADGRYPGADERRARTTLYSLRSYERRTDYVVPRETSKW